MKGSSLIFKRGMVRLLGNEQRQPVTIPLFAIALCDNLPRNIIYIGDTMQQNVSGEVKQKVYNDFVIPHISGMARYLGFLEEDFIKTNNDLKNYVLKISKNL